MSEVTRCKRCGRTLKNPVYVDVGYGKVCAAKEGIVVHKSDKCSGCQRMGQRTRRQRLDRKSKGV